MLSGVKHRKDIHQVTEDLVDDFVVKALGHRKADFAISLLIQQRLLLQPDYGLVNVCRKFIAKVFPQLFERPARPVRIVTNSRMRF